MIPKKVRREVFGFLARWLAPGLLKGLRASNRYSVKGEQHLARLVEENQNYIISFWHGQMLPMLFYFTQSRFDHTKFYTFISPHRDGEYISRVASGFGIHSLRTSLRDPRVRAIGKAIRHARNGQNLVLTPDGPVGPAFVAQPGVIRLSTKTGVPVLPAAALSSRAHYFDSWDHFCLPLPLGRVQVRFGRPLDFAASGDLDQQTQELQETLRGLSRSVSADIPGSSRYRRWIDTSQPETAG